MYLSAGRCGRVRPVFRDPPWRGMALVADEDRTGNGYCRHHGRDEKGELVAAGLVEDHTAQVAPQSSSHHVDGRDEPGDEPDVSHAVQGADKRRGERRRHEEREPKTQGEDPEGHSSLEEQDHDEEDHSEGEGDDDGQSVADRVGGGTGEKDAGETEEAEPGQHARRGAGGDAVVGDQGHQMGGDEGVRAPTDEHDHCEQPQGAGPHGLREGEVPGAVNDADRLGQRSRGSRLRRTRLLFAAARPKGSQSELLRIATDDREREDEIDDQGDDAHPEARTFPAGDVDHVREDGDEEELSEAVAGEREADGHSSSLLEPVADERPEQGDSRPTQPGCVQYSEV